MSVANFRASAHRWLAAPFRCDMCCRPLAVDLNGSADQITNRCGGCLFADGDIAAQLISLTALVGPTMARRLLENVA
jgi:hypothetical protein